MDIFFEAHKQLFIDLINGNVKFILVGGYAVNVHGYIRATNDMDLWIKPTNENKLLLIEVLRKKGFDEEGLKQIDQQNFEEAFVFHIWQKPLRVDFITRVKGVLFEEADAQKILLPLKDLTVPVIQLHHLILTKITNGRPQDIADVDRLQQISKHRKK